MQGELYTESDKEYIIRMRRAEQRVARPPALSIADK